MSHGRTGILTLLLACGARLASAAEPAAALQEAIARGTAFLVARQSADGGWRSNVYGNFRAGDALSPLALVALEPEAAASRAGCGFLDRLAAMDDGDHGLDYPAYTAALAVRALVRHGAERAAIDRWITTLRCHQLAERLGWRPDDAEFGGWGYALVEPRKPGAEELRLPLLEPNLSATVFAIEALRASGVAAGAPAVAAALVFVERCQNVAPVPERGAGAGGRPADLRTAAVGRLGWLAGGCLPDRSCPNCHRSVAAGVNAGASGPFPSMHEAGRVPPCPRRSAVSRPCA